MMIFTTLSKNQDSAHKGMDRIIELFVLLGILCFICLTCCSCGSTKVAKQLVRNVRVDTIYLSNMQYDSIHIYQNHVSELHPGTLSAVGATGRQPGMPMRTDTLYIKDVSMEYRYKLLRDTVQIMKRDSVPYEVTVTEVREITRPLTWYDHLSRAILWLNIACVLFFLVRFIFKKKLTIR